MLIQVIVQKYPNPCQPGGFGFMTHSDDLEACGVYGFGTTDQEAVDAFAKEMIEVKEKSLTVPKD